MHFREIDEGSGLSLDLGIEGGDGGCFEEFVVDFVGDEWVGESAEVLFQGGGGSEMSKFCCGKVSKLSLITWTWLAPPALR
jgi:hypothetical protein